MLERFLDFLIVEPQIKEIVEDFTKEGFAIACSVGLESDGTFRRYPKQKWWEDLQIYDTKIPHYESDLPSHRRAYLTYKLSPPLNQPPFNEIPVAHVLVSRARVDNKGIIIGPAKLGRPQIFLHDPYFGNDSSMLERLQRVADKTLIPIASPMRSNQTDVSE